MGYTLKKRPSNVILGRVFNQKVLDMYDFQILYMKEMTQNVTFEANLLPTVIFQGDQFENDDVMRDVKNFWLDFLGGNHQIKKVNIMNMTRQVVITALSKKEILIEQFQCKVSEEMAFKGDIQPEMVGPSLKLKITKHSAADKDVMKEALKQRRSKHQAEKKQHNKYTTNLGQTKGQLFISQQNMGTLALRKFNKRRKTGEKEETHEFNDE